MSNIPSHVDPTSLNEQEQNELSPQETEHFVERMDKEIHDDSLRRKMHQDLIDSYDEELENELDDYVQDYRFDGRELTDDEKLDRRTYFQELVRLQRELIKLQDWVVNSGEKNRRHLRRS